MVETLPQVVAPDIEQNQNIICKNTFNRSVAKENDSKLAEVISITRSDKKDYRVQSIMCKF